MPFIGLWHRVLEVESVLQPASVADAFHEICQSLRMEKKLSLIDDTDS